MSIYLVLLIFCLVVGGVTFVMGRFMSVGLATVSAICLVVGGALWALTGLNWAWQSDVIWESGLKAFTMMCCVGVGGLGLFAGSVSGHPRVPAP